MSDLERLELYEKLERAEGRIVALEKQVKPGDIKENFKMDDGNDDSVLFGNIARSLPRVLLITGTNREALTVFIER